jgi:hypothetical protein
LSAQNEQLLSDYRAALGRQAMRDLYGESPPPGAVLPTSNARTLRREISGLRTFLNNVQAVNTALQAMAASDGSLAPPPLPNDDIASWRDRPDGLALLRTARTEFERRSGGPRVGRFLHFLATGELPTARRDRSGNVDEAPGGGDSSSEPSSGDESPPPQQFS